VTAIPLGRPLPAASSNQPGRRLEDEPCTHSARLLTPEPCCATPIRFCSRWGLPCRSCYQSRGALLPHRFTLTAGTCVRTLGRGGLFSVALSLGSPPPDVIRHRVSLEPGLSSASRRRPSGRLATRSSPFSRTCDRLFTAIRLEVRRVPAAILYFVTKMLRVQEILTFPKARSF
jgi:hypothetical protein